VASGCPSRCSRAFQAIDSPIVLFRIYFRCTEFLPRYCDCLCSQDPFFRRISDFWYLILDGFGVARTSYLRFLIFSGPTKLLVRYSRFIWTIRFFFSIILNFSFLKVRTTSKRKTI